MKTNWNTKLLYTSINDPRIEKDVRSVERAYAAFEKKYRTKTKSLASPVFLARALNDYEELAFMVEARRPSIYLHLLSDLDSTNNEAEAMGRRISERFTKADNKVEFFGLALGQLAPAVQKKLLKATILKPYVRYLEMIFARSKHFLTEAEEKIISLKYGPSRSMWISGVDKAVSKKIVTFKGKKLSLQEALSKVLQLPIKKERDALWSACKKELQTVAEFAESEMNAIVTDKKISDELRGYPKPYSATVTRYENDERVVSDLLEAVSSHYKIAHKYYEIKRRLHKLPRLSYADRSIPYGSVQKKYTFEQSVAAVGDTFQNTGVEYRAILDSYIKNGQIDVYPKKNRAGGAYCLHVHGLPTFIFLNHVNDFRSLTTLAHEMGHAIHTERSRTQPRMYQGYSTSVAETASTFFEALVADAVSTSLGKEDRIAFLYDKLQDEISTIFRQVAFFRFELELHETIRAKGWLPKEDIQKMFAKHLKEHLGPAFDIADDDGLSFIYIGHFRNFFYVYTYAYGLLVSKALKSMYEKDPTSIKKIDQFLSAGGSKKPEQIFKDIGIPVGKKLFIEGLKSIERDVNELDALTKNR